MTAPRYSRHEFSELVDALGWLPWEYVMAWAYIDESGDHYPKGHRHQGKYKRLTLAGVVALCEDWRRFETEWAQILTGRHPRPTEMLHMTALESRRHKLYRGWSTEDRRLFLEHFQRVLLKMSRASFFGTSVDIPDPDGPIGEAYRSRISDAVVAATKHAMGSDRVHFVFAHNNAVRPERLLEIVQFLKRAVPRFGTYTFDGDPTRILPLQVADFAAYEIGRFIKIGGDISKARPSFLAVKKHPYFNVRIPEIDRRSGTWL